MQITLAGASANTVITLGHTLRLVATEMFELDHRELGVFAEGPNVRLFENTPGGCGHLTEMEKRGLAWLEAAAAKLTGSPEHNETCRTACLNCILTSATQFDVEAGRIQRIEALGYLERLLKTKAVPSAALPSRANPVTEVEDLPPINDLVAALRSKRNSGSKSKTTRKR
jgi:DEAD/DEAH box helicase domain-containing protein